MHPDNQDFIQAYRDCKIGEGQSVGTVNGNATKISKVLEMQDSWKDLEPITVLSNWYINLPVERRKPKMVGNVIGLVRDAYLIQKDASLFDLSAKDLAHITGVPLAEAETTTNKSSSFSLPFTLQTKETVPAWMKAVVESMTFEEKVKLLKG